MNIKKSLAAFCLTVVSLGSFPSEITVADKDNYCTAQVLYNTVFYPALNKKDASDQDIKYNLPDNLDDEHLSMYLSSIEKWNAPDADEKAQIDLAIEYLTRSPADEQNSMEQLTHLVASVNSEKKLFILLAARRGLDLIYKIESSIFLKKITMHSIAMCDLEIWKGIVDAFLANKIVAETRYKRSKYNPQTTELIHNAGDPLDDKDQEMELKTIKKLCKNYLRDRQAMKSYSKQAFQTLKNNPKYK